MKKTRYKKVCKFELEVTVPIWGFKVSLHILSNVGMCIPVCATKNVCKRTTMSPHPLPALTSFFFYYIVIYIKGLRSFVLVLWMQRQCPVVTLTVCFSSSGSVNDWDEKALGSRVPPGSPENRTQENPGLLWPWRSPANLLICNNINYWPFDHFSHPMKIILTIAKHLRWFHSCR